MLALDTRTDATQPCFITAKVSCGLEAEAGSFSWSDLPIQGEYLMDSHDFLTCEQPKSISQAPGLPSLPQAPSLEFEEEISDGFSWMCPASPTSVATPLELAETLEKSCTLDAPAHRRKVSFSNVIEIRTHEVVLGDHPFCRGGMALALGQRHSETELVDLETYDSHSKHRRMGQLYLSFYKRRERLREATGMSGCELLRAEYKMCCDQAPSTLHRTARMSEC